jgi:hypothetical protein
MFAVAGGDPFVNPVGHGRHGQKGGAGRGARL